MPFNLRSALDSVTVPAPGASTAEKTRYAEGLSREFTQALETSMRTHFPHTFSGGGTGIPAASARGIKSIDVAFNIQGLFLGLGVSVKTVGIPESGRGYVHNMKRISEEWALETINYHRYMPFAIIVGILFLPVDSASDRALTSSLCTAVNHFRVFAGRVDHREYEEMMERIYIGLYQRKPFPLYGTARFFNVLRAVPTRGLPPKGDLQTFESVKDELVAAFKVRNPRLRVTGMP